MKQNDLQQVLAATKALENKLNGTGWEKVSVGQSARIDYNSQFDLYMRQREVSGVIKAFDDKKVLSSNANSKSPDNVWKNRMVSKACVRESVYDTTPCASMAFAIKTLMPDLSEYKSLESIRSDVQSIVISYHCSYWFEYDHGSMNREILCWSFCTIPEGSNKIHEYVFLRKSNRLLPLDLALGRILDDLPVSPIDTRSVKEFICMGDINPSTSEREELHFRSAEEAISHSQEPYANGKAYRIEYNWSKNRFPGLEYLHVSLLSHAGKANLSGFEFSDDYVNNVLKKCIDVQGGIINSMFIRTYPRSIDYDLTKSRNIYKYPIQLSICDTVCHAPQDVKRITDLGNVVGVPTKIFRGVNRKALHHLLQTDPVLFMEYNSAYSLIPLLYTGMLYGFNRTIPATLTSKSAAVMKDSIMSYLGCGSDREYNEKYRGMRAVRKGLRKRDDEDRLSPDISEEPISHDAAIVWKMFTEAYHGGYNSSSTIGFYTEETYDYDLKNAYPTAMCLVPDIDWKNPILKTIRDRTFVIDDFMDPLTGDINPFLPMVACVTFDFPDYVSYPSIPIVDDGSLVFPLASLEGEYTYVAGPEIYTALMLGATVFCKEGIVAKVLMQNGQPAYSLRAAVKQMVSDRAKAKQVYGKGSLVELVLKSMVCSGYGKTAQNVIQKTRWDAYYGEMRNMESSIITNPVSACLTTSIIRSLLLAVQNEADELFYTSFSVTTDGFITNLNERTLKALPLLGMRPFIENARRFLTDGVDSELWEMKHIQNDLLNYTTRGNVSLNTGEAQEGTSEPEATHFRNPEYKLPGVCAHNGAKSEYESDSYLDRLWLMKSVVSRTGRVPYSFEEFTPFQKLISGEAFRRKLQTKNANMDFDMKRKPQKESFQKQIVQIDGVDYEIMNFQTVPFKNIAEYREYRQKAKGSMCLRTQLQWDTFFLKLIVKDNKPMKITDSEWRILFDCIAGHRAGLWTIPKLDELSGAERIKWVSMHSPRPYTADDWKNAGRPARQRNLLPKDMLKKKLSELQAE